MWLGHAHVVRLLTNPGADVATTRLSRKELVTITSTLRRNTPPSFSLLYLCLGEVQYSSIISSPSAAAPRGGRSICLIGADLVFSETLSASATLNVFGVSGVNLDENRGRWRMTIAADDHGMYQHTFDLCIACGICPFSIAIS